jgi:outer membrane protein
LSWDFRYVRLLGNYLECNIVNHKNFRFGPAAFYRFGRDDDIDDDVVKKVHEVDGTIEMGGFVGYRVFMDDSLRARYGVQLQFLHDVGGEHEGYIFQLSGNMWYPVSMPVDLGLIGGATYASDDYMSAFFGVTQADSAASGLMAFDADGAVKDVYIQPSMMIHFSKKWHLGVGVRFKFLLSDAEDSPVVDDRGSNTQILGGVGVAYAW